MLCSPEPKDKQGEIKVESHRKAHKLGTTGTHPQQAYGHTVQGAATSQVHKMRSNLKLGTKFGHTKSCLTTTLAWVYGSSKDPAVSTKIDQIALWIDLWQSYDQHTRSRVRNLWKRLLPRLGLDRPNMWKRAKGPITGTMAAVLEIGWKPLTPDRWLAGDHLAIIDGAKYTKAHILGRVRKDIETNLWSEATKHGNSTGLAKGALLHPARQARASLVKEGNFAAARALDYLVCGVIAEPTPNDEGKYRNEHMCHRCDQQVPATRRHDLWQCKANRDIDNEFIKKSHWTVKNSERGWDDHQCLYARGIVPLDWIEQPDGIDFLDAKTWESKGFKDTINSTKFACSDGSGGPRDVPRTVTQVAFGAVSFDFVPTGPDDFELKQLACIGGQVPGRQTAPRAELWGAIQTLLRVDSWVDIDLGIDAAYVTKGVTNRRSLESSLNGDLWSLLFGLIDERTVSTNIFKVDSHLEEKGPKVIQNRDIRFDHLVGNALADEVAGAAAEKFKPNMNQLSKAKWSEILGFTVAKRLAIIQADIWANKSQDDYIYELDKVPDKNETKQVVANSRAMLSLLRSGHRLHRSKAGHQCEGCKVYRALKTSAIGRKSNVVRGPQRARSSNGGDSKTKQFVNKDYKHRTQSPPPPRLSSKPTTSITRTTTSSPRNRPTTSSFWPRNSGRRNRASPSSTAQLNDTK